MCEASARMLSILAIVFAIGSSQQDGAGTASVGNYKLKLGLMMPNDDPYLKLKMGFATSASAVTLALDRVRREQLLPGAHFSIMWNFTECDEAQSVGTAIELFQQEAVDVIIGPACSMEAVAIGILAKFYNFPLVSWAAIGNELEDRVRFPTLTRTIGSAKRLGRALRELLLNFRWQQVALLGTDDKTTRKCHFIAEGIHKTLLRSSVKIELRMDIDYPSPTDDDMMRFLKELKKSARIVIVCLDLIEDRRRFMLHVSDAGMATNEYVFIFPDYMPEENRTLPWLDYQGLKDERDDDAKKAFEKSIVIEFQQAEVEKLHVFKKAIPNKMREWPFYYSPKPDEMMGSSFSPFLYDAVYLYCLAVNRTLTKGGNLKNGTQIMESSKNVQFEGMSGPVAIDDIADREPNFIIKGFDQKAEYVTFGVARMFMADGQTIELKVPEWFIWEGRGGKRPTDVPECGFQGELCVATGNSALVIAISVFLAILVVGAVVAAIVIYIRKKFLKDLASRIAWKINYGDIIKLDVLNADMSKDLSSSEGCLSVGSHGQQKFENAELAYYKGVLVWVRNYHRGAILTSTTDHLEFRQMWELSNENLNRFIGLCVDSPVPLSLWSYGSRGSLEDVFRNDNKRMNWLFTYSMIRDLTDGMTYLHSSLIQSHGYLKPSNCVVDSRFVLKVSDYGLTRVRQSQKLEPKQLLWTAPELLRMDHDRPVLGTQKGDIYSFGIIIQEMLTRDRPYGGLQDEQTPEEILMRVKKGELPPFRPIVKLPEGTDVNPAILNIMRDCLEENPVNRPDFKIAKLRLKEMEKGRHINLVDQVMTMMEKYAGNLESLVNERMSEIVEEKKKSDILLYRMLPKSVADKLKAGQQVDPENYEDATIFVSDVVGFTTLSSRSTPMQVVNLLNELYSLFDDIIDEYDVYKVETMGDGYLCVSGLPHRNGNRHASEIADMSLQLQHSIRSFCIPHLPNEKVQLRIGVHTGSCVAGVVGLTMPRYCLFGESVNTASKMESHGKPGCIHITSETNQILTQVIGGYRTRPRGEVLIRGKGVLTTFWLLGRMGSKNIEDETETSGSPTNN